MEDLVTWDQQTDSEEDTRRRLAQCESVLAHLTTGVLILEPTRDRHAPLRVAMVNDVARCYFGRICDGSEPIADTQVGLRSSGVLDLALLTSVTGQEHLQEAMPVPGTAATGQLIDLEITPLADGAVSITFQDVTRRVRRRALGS